MDDNYKEPGVTSARLIEMLDAEAMRRKYSLGMRWKIQMNRGGIAKLVAYNDARDLRMVLNNECGPHNWSVEPRSINGKVYMALSINTVDSGWVTKADTGEEKSIGGAKAEASDAFKRACYAWGFLTDVYNADHVVLNYSEANKCPLTKDGELLKTSAALNAYCNGVSTSMYQLRVLYSYLSFAAKDNKELLDAFSVIKKYCK